MIVFSHCDCCLPQPLQFAYGNLLGLERPPGVSESDKRPDTRLGAEEIHEHVNYEHVSESFAQLLAADPADQATKRNQLA